MSWLSGIALSAPSIAGDGTRWEDYDESAQAQYEKARDDFGPDNEEQGVPTEMLIRHTARFLQQWHGCKDTPHLLALAGWLAVAQDDRVLVRQAEKVTV